MNYEYNIYLIILDKNYRVCLLKIVLPKYARRWFYCGQCQGYLRRTDLGNLNCSWTRSHTGLNCVRLMHRLTTSSIKVPVDVCIEEGSEETLITRTRPLSVSGNESVHRTVEPVLSMPGPKLRKYVIYDDNLLSYLISNSILNFLTTFGKTVIVNNI